MKRVATALFLVICLSTAFAQQKIPKDLPGTWILDLPGEGEPSQIMKWVFLETDSVPIAEFHWLFKIATDKDFITLAVIKGKLIVEGDMFTSKTFMTGSQQSESGGMEFYDEIKWFHPGDPQFESYQKEKSHHFEIVGDKFKVKDDHNGDGDYDDKEEVAIYTRVN